jgi:hypothetical protein
VQRDLGDELQLSLAPAAAPIKIGWSRPAL